MAKMTAAEAAVYVLEKEGVTQLFGIPGAGINPVYAALKKHGTMKHILARHGEGIAHIATPDHHIDEPATQPDEPQT